MEQTSILPYQNTATKFNDIHNYPGWRVFENWISAFQGVGLKEEEKKENLPIKGPGNNVVPGLPIFLSEIGYGSIPDFQKTNTIFKEKGNPLTATYRDHMELEKAYNKALMSLDLISSIKLFQSWQHYSTIFMVV